MNERLLETWLNKANERSFQIPFCHALASQGYTVVHMSRHCGMEMGKDILAIAPDGVPCAYQLKGVDGGRMSLGKWRSELGQQVWPLVNGRIVHSSITSQQQHRSFVVINGDFDEEVLREIDDINRRNAESGFPERTLQTITKGQLFQMMKELQSDFWATQLTNVKTYLEMFLEDGRGQLPKAKLAALFEAGMPFRVNAATVNQCERAIIGCAIICASAISSYTVQANHVAEFEAWTLFMSYQLALVERWQIPIDKLKHCLSIAEEAIFSSLERLCDELCGREQFVEGDMLLDWRVYRARMTHLLGLMGVYGLWCRFRDRSEDAKSPRHQFLRSFCRDNSNALHLWGEYAVPQILANGLFRRTFDASLHYERMLFGLIQSIVSSNMPKQDGEEKPLHNPYYEPEVALPVLFGFEKCQEKDSFVGSSFYLEGLLHLLVRCNFKEGIRELIPAVTHIDERWFTPELPWQFFVFKNSEDGAEHCRIKSPPYRWKALREISADCRGEDVPGALKGSFMTYMCILIVMPHRVTAGTLRWLVNEVEKHILE